MGSSTFRLEIPDRYDPKTCGVASGASLIYFYTPCVLATIETSARRNGITCSPTSRLLYDLFPTVSKSSVRKKQRCFSHQKNEREKQRESRLNLTITSSLFQRSKEKPAAFCKEATVCFKSSFSLLSNSLSFCKVATVFFKSSFSSFRLWTTFWTAVRA